MRLETLSFLQNAVPLSNIFRISDPFNYKLLKCIVKYILIILLKELILLVQIGNPYTIET